MEAARSEAEDDVAGHDALSGQLLAPLDGADAEAGEVVVARAVHAGHLRRLAADEGAAGEAAALGDAGDDGLGGAGLKLAGCEIVEEEQRLGALHDQVVDAHGDEVDADRVVPAGVDGELQLGADAVRGRDEQRVGEPGSLRIEKRAEAAQLWVGTGTARGGDERSDGAHERVARLDRHAGAGIGVGAVPGGSVVRHRGPRPNEEEEQIRLPKCGSKYPAVIRRAACARGRQW